MIETIKQFLVQYGVTQKYLNANGISYHQSLKYRDTPIKDLPEDVRKALVAIFTRFGVGHE